MDRTSDHIIFSDLVQITFGYFGYRVQCLNLQTVVTDYNRMKFNQRYLDNAAVMQFGK